MKKYYTQPELEIRNYACATSQYVTTSVPETNENNDLNKDDEYDYFG